MSATISGCINVCTYVQFFPTSWRLVPCEPSIHYVALRSRMLESMAFMAISFRCVSPATGQSFARIGLDDNSTMNRTH